MQASKGAVPKMPRLFNRILATPVVLGAVALAMFAVQATPASAASAGIASVTGTGTISPPLSGTGLPAPHAYTFTSTTITTTGVVHNAPVVLNASSCTSSGGSITEVAAGGVGTGTWSCSTGALAGTSGSLIYARVGVLVPVVLTGGLDGALLCVFQPDQLPPADVSSYHLTCAGA